MGLESDKPFWRSFERAAADHLGSLPAGATALDLGGGRRCVYAGALAESHSVRLVAVDVSAEELALNSDVTETCVANAAEDLPFEDQSVDFVVSRALLEHIDGVPALIRNVARVLKPGGQMMHFVACRYSLFGTAARLLPFKRLLALLHLAEPTADEQVEFDVVYDHCHPRALRTMVEQSGFRSVSVSVCWAQPGYFEPVFPIFVLTSLYESIVRGLGIEKLTAYMVVSAVR